MGDSHLSIARCSGSWILATQSAGDGAVKDLIVLTVALGWVTVAAWDSQAHTVDTVELGVWVRDALTHFILSHIVKLFPSTLQSCRTPY